MDSKSMTKPITLRIDAGLYRSLHEHLFPGDRDEHGAVIAIGVAETDREIRLLARDLFVASDGVDYVPGRRGYRALTPAFVAEKSHYCAINGLGYLAVHCHGGRDFVAFSADDLASHARGYRALLQITGGPVGALVFATDAVAGSIWTREGQFLLNHAIIIGSRIFRLFPNRRTAPPSIDPTYDRHARLFGDLGQAILQGLKVGIIGLGGAGSLLNEWIARLGVGHIIAIDPDRVAQENLPRQVGATINDLRADAGGPVYKVEIARRVAEAANPNIRFEAISGDIVDASVAQRLRDADFIFLAADPMQPRLVFNALVHQYLIPGAQVGVKAEVNRADGRVEQLFAATRTMIPIAESGCLSCQELILPTRLAEESLTPQERRAQRYVDHPEVEAPSVITLNALACAQAANDLMMIFTGLFKDGTELPFLLNFADERRLGTVIRRRDPDCPHCGPSSASARARGDRRALPCRQR